MKSHPKKTVTPLLGQVLKKLAPRIGATVLIEPKWGIVGKVTFKNGVQRYFRYSSLDLNPLGASEIAKDKGWANFFMEKMGYPIVQSRTFYSKRWSEAIGSSENIDAAYRYAQTLGWPVFVKPNSGSQGQGVALVHNKREFYRAMNFIFTRDKVALVQKPVRGRDYRLVVLDNRLISAYERTPLNVIGDGNSTIEELLHQKQKLFVASSRDTTIKLDDPRIKQKLRREKMNLNTIPPLGTRVFLLDNANLSTGGDSKDVTGEVHIDLKKMAIKLTKDMGLRLCGVDLIAESDIGGQPTQYRILEINAAPGLDHYVKAGKAQEKVVEDLYLEVLMSMSKRL